MNGSRADSFLHLIRRSQRGRLKIYLGYAAGVGKTYQMLQEAHRLKTEGVDVAVGLAETHGRKETEALLPGLELIPRRRMVYRGITIEEMDLLAVLARRPSVVLVDELAHTNAPGCKNAKRYQDVEEILAAGIHVISTLNIQHLESLYETVEGATGIKVRERIPDRVVAEADQIVNVDLTTEDLRRRLQEGKVYIPERIETALANFFRPSNLEQLRELTLRELAAQIDSRRREPLAEEAPSNPDQVLACLSSRGPNSEALLRYASRLAGHLNRNWYAIYVQTLSEGPTAIDAETQRLLSNTLTLAQQLGATVFTYKGDDVVKTIIQFAKEYRVGHIVVGTPTKKVPFMKRLRGTPSFVERLIKEGKGITVVVLDTREVETRSAPSSVTDAGDMIESTKKDQVAIPRDSFPGNVQAVFWKDSLEKEEAIRQLLSECCRTNPSVPEEAAWQALLLRESQGSTFLGEDVALPHARIEGLNIPVLGIGVAQQGVHERATGKMVRIVFLLLSPTEPADIHVRLLGQVSRLIQDDPFRQELGKVTGADEVMRLLQARGMI